MSKIALGQPIPDSPYAVSVSLPTRDDVVGYEESDPRVINAMKSGYPRFRYHDFYVSLRDQYNLAREGNFAMPFPSERVAAKCVKFVGQGHVETTRDGVALAVMPLGNEAMAKAFWQHSGLIVSARQAENILTQREAQDPTIAKNEIKGLLTNYAGADSKDIYLFPSGMAALFSAYEAVTRNGANGKTIQLGFPYLDTLKIQQKFGEGAKYVPYQSVDDLVKLEDVLKTGGITAVFCEIPGNPLLQTVDLPALRELLDYYKVPLIIDDTVGSFENVNALPYADILVTSLTKFFSGVGDAMAGSLILNPRGAFYSDLRARIDAQYEDLLYPDEAEVLAVNARDYPMRMKVVNMNAQMLAEHLNEHPAIERVYYPTLVNKTEYDAIKKRGGGYGGLLSFTTKDRGFAGKVYDRLDVDKGPSLGTNYTLVCPYTLLAHYNEKAFAEENGIDYELLRVSVGKENIKGILERFDRALG